MEPVAQRHAGDGPSGSSLPSPVGLVGLGLMGGSLARALAAVDDPPDVWAWSRDARDLDEARAEGVVAEVPSSAAEVAEAAALVVYAVPLGAAVTMLGAHRGRWRDDAVITDVASLKAPLVAAARSAGLSGRYVGGHPMAGGEGTGFGASRPDLYRDADVWITTDTGSAEARAVVESVWRAVGSRPRPVEAETHDRRMVWASHLPQLVANALAHVLDGAGLARTDLGPGGRDMTRLAASAPEMWIDLLDESGPRAARALDALGGALHGLARDLREGRTDEIGELMEETRRWTAGETP